MICMKYSFIACTLFILAGCQSIPQSSITKGSVSLSESTLAEAQVHTDRLDFKKLKKLLLNDTIQRICDKIHLQWK